MFSLLAGGLIIVRGLFVLLGFYALYLLIKFLIRAIAVLDIYLDEKRNRGGRI